jgi:protein-tyrosine phosphatase
MFSRVLVVCLGNICRSPMGEVLLREALKAQRGLTVASAGIRAVVGRGADPMAVTLMRERGLDLTAHKAQQLTPQMVKDFELILVMEKAQQRAIEALEPTSRGRVHCIGRWGDFEVPDPYGKDRAAFEESLQRLDEGIAAFQGRFWRG